VRRTNNIPNKKGILPKAVFKSTSPTISGYTPHKITTHSKTMLNTEAALEDDAPLIQAKTSVTSSSSSTTTNNLSRNSENISVHQRKPTVSSRLPSTLEDECIKLLQAKQYRSCEILTMFHLSSLDCNGTENEAYAQKATAYEILGDCTMHQQQEKRALAFYRKAQSNLRSLRLQLPLFNQDYHNSGLVQTSNEANLKLKEARALAVIGDTVEAISILESSVPKSHPLRNFAISMELGTFYITSGRNMDAKICYLDALSRNPYAIEAIEKLVMLQVERAEVMRVINGAIQTKKEESGKENQTTSHLDIPMADIVTAYFYSNRSTSSHQMNALSQWKKLHTDYPQNIHVLLQIAILQSKHPTCDLAHAAAITFQKIRSMDHNFIDGMDYYASILAKQLNLSELGKLSSDLLMVNNKRPEAWNALALYHDVCGDSEKALACIERGISCNKQHAYSYQLKGSILLRQERYDIAVHNFSRANSIQVDISCYEGMVESYLHNKRYKEAICTAKEAMSFAPRDSRSLTLVGLALSQASLFSRDSGGKDRAKKALKKALILDPMALRPILALADLYLADDEVEACTGLLKKAIDDMGQSHFNDTSPGLSSHMDEIQVVLFSKLGLVYSKNKKYKEAVTYYHKALSMNPEYDEARRGIEQMENVMKGVESRSVEERETYDYIDYRDDIM
jgi:anaphase-promoting complex subunit 7